jgi:hypothetical protein
MNISFHNNLILDTQLRYNLLKGIKEKEWTVQFDVGQ